MEILNEKDKEYFYNILELDKTYPNLEFDNYIKKVIDYYGNITDVPLTIANLMVFSKNLNSEIRTDLITILQNGVAFKLLMNGELANCLDPEVIDFCIEKYKQDNTNSIYNDYTIPEPSIYENMSDKVANKLAYAFKEELISNSRYSFILKYVSDDKFVKDIVPFILNNKSLEAIISNKRLSEDLRKDVLMETRLMDVSNLTDDMKLCLYDYYLEGFNNNPDDVYIRQVMLTMCSEPEKYLTPDLEIDLLNNMSTKPNHILYYYTLSESTKSSETIKRLYDLTYIQPFNRFVKPYMNPHISLETRCEILKDILTHYKQFHSNYSEEDKKLFGTIITELCNSYKGENLEKLYDILKNFFAKSNVSINSLTAFKLAVLPGFNVLDFVDKYTYIDFNSFLTSSKLKFFANANKILSKTDLSLEFKRAFLSTFVYVALSGGSGDSIFSSFEFNSEYKNLVNTQNKLKITNKEIENERISFKNYCILSKMVKQFIHKYGHSDLTVAGCKLMLELADFINDTYNKNRRDMTKLKNYTKEELIDALNDYYDKIFALNNEMEEFLFRETESEKMTSIVNEIISRGLLDDKDIKNSKKILNVIKTFANIEETENNISEKEYGR